METTVHLEANDNATPHLPRDVLDHLWNLASAGCLAAARLEHVAFATVLLQAAGAPPKDGTALANREIVRRLQAYARAQRPVPRPVEAADPRAASNLGEACEALGLGPVERDVVSFLILASESFELQALLGAIPCRSLGTATRVLAAAVGHGVSHIEAALAPAARLRGGGFVTVDHRACDFEEAFTLDRRFWELSSASGLTREAVLDRFLPRAPEPKLGFDDFPSVAGTARLIGRLLAAALDRRTRGVNVLLHGPTGGGKTELARLLAREARASLYVAGHEDPAGLSPEHYERLGSLRLGHRVLEGTRSLILFDEIEDLFVRDQWSRAAGIHARDSARMSKLWFNQLLESAVVPTIWLSNDVSAMDPSYLRRFAVALELRWPSLSQRKRLWRRYLGDDLSLTEPEVDRLAVKYPISPAQIRSATESARLAGEASELPKTLEAIVGPVAALVAPLAAAPPLVSEADYDPALAATRVDLAALADRLATGFREDEGGRAGLSLCLYGPPGTGKSEYVRYLARRLDRPLVVRRCSDLLAKWVGDTEKQIAHAFAEAREERGVLLLDEADSFLRDRRRAAHTWETTQVNELLQQMESCPGVVACTTNLFEDIDQAALRRFTFRIAFEHLAPDKARALLCRLLGGLGVRVDDGDRAAAEAAVGRIGALTPGDFAVVARRLRLLGTGAVATAADVVRELAAEVAVKERPGRKAGFAPILG
jgi:AAA+ superfamily predicted ATPase